MKKQGGKIKMKIDKEEDLPCESESGQKKILMTMDKNDIIDRYFYRHNRMYNMLIVSMLILMIVCGVIGYFIGTISDSKEIKQLGQAICEEEYNMDFKSYYNQELKCKPKEIKYEKQYDGIKVQKII